MTTWQDICDEARALIGDVLATESAVAAVAGVVAGLLVYWIFI